MTRLILCAACGLKKQASAYSWNPRTRAKYDICRECARAKKAARQTAVRYSRRRTDTRLSILGK